MSSTPREIGTLIVVLLKARHLPNKRHIGKQDPYCVVALNGEKRRTRAVKRGGQHPEWDEEVRFTLYENEDTQVKPTDGAGTPPPPPPKTTSLPDRVKGGKGMILSCYADDPREPDLIGESTVDLTEVLTKGETDEWFTLHNKDKYCGEVYLELTFWSNEPPPEKKTAASKLSKMNKQYGGPGSFVPSGEFPSSLAAGHGTHPSRIMSTNSIIDHSRHGSVPAALRTSSSVAKLDLYVPPYERTDDSAAVDRIATDFGEMRVSDLRRRESYPPPLGAYTQQPSILSPATPSPYDQSRYSDTEPIYLYDRPLTPQANSLHHRNSLSGSTDPYQAQLNYRPPYELASTPYPSHQSTMRPRIGIPTSSSGFMPLQSHSSSNFTPLSPHPTESTGFIPLQSHSSSSFSSLSSHTSESTGFVPPPSQTPVSLSYHHSHYNHHPGFAPAPTPTPAPTNFVPPLPQSSSTPFSQSQTFVPSSSFQFSQYTTPQPGMAPHQYIASQPVGAPQLPMAGSQPLQPMYSTATPSPPHEAQSQIQQFASQSNFSSTTGSSSRPLPQPQVVGQQQVQHQAQLPLPPVPNPQSQLPYNPVPTPLPLSVNPTYQTVPPPPPPPPPPSVNSLPSTNSQPLSINGVQPNNTALVVLPPPPPPPLMSSNSLSWRPALPQPPLGYQAQQQNVFHPVPPPPPPPNLSQSNRLPPPPPPPMNVSQSYFPSPPQQMLNHAQWPA